MIFAISLSLSLIYLQATAHRVDRSGKNIQVGQSFCICLASLEGGPVQSKGMVRFYESHFERRTLTLTNFNSNENKSLLLRTAKESEQDA